MNLILFWIVVLQFSFVFSMENPNFKNLLEESKPCLEQNSTTAIINQLYKIKQSNKFFKLSAEEFNHLDSCLKNLPEYTFEFLESLKASNRAGKEVAVKLLREKLLLGSLKVMVCLSMLEDVPSPGVSLRISSTGLPIIRNCSSGSL